MEVPLGAPRSIFTLHILRRGTNTAAVCMFYIYRSVLSSGGRKASNKSIASSLGRLF